MKTIFGQQTTKVKQLADLISQDISMGRYKTDTALPSINQLSHDYKVSRDTVFKAFIDLKERGIIVRCLGSHLRITAGSEAENAALTAALDGILV